MAALAEGLGRTGLLNRGLPGLLVEHLGGLREEVLLSVYADRQGRHLGHILLAGEASRIGGRYRVLIEPALRLGACGFLLAHNHPSGDPTPSGADVAMTRGLLALARVLDVELVDHLVVGGQRVCSMRGDTVFAAVPPAEAPAGTVVERASSADCARWSAHGGRRRAAA